MKSSLVILISLGIVLGQSQNKDFASFKMLSRTLDKCSDQQDLFTCLKVKAVNILDRASTMDTLPLSEFLTITKDPRAVQDPLGVPPYPTLDQDLESSLPRDLVERNTLLDQLIKDKLSKYLRTRTIRLNVPAEVFEGRKKYKKGGGLLIVFGAFASMLLQLALGKVAVIAGKALIVGKIALLLAAIVGLKSLLSHKDEGHSSQVIYAEPEHHGGWGRSLRGAPRDSQEIVYTRSRHSKRT